MGSGYSLTGAQSHGGMDALAALAGRATTLLQRILDVERTLAVQEWWMLGRAVREAGILAEVISLLAVARGELEDVLTGPFGQPRSFGDAGELPPPPPLRLEDPEWVHASRDQAIGLLRMAASALPAMRQYADMLRQSAERINMPVAATDGLGIVADRLGEAYEALAHPTI
jgi:hypothetical protein